MYFILDGGFQLMMAKKRFHARFDLSLSIESLGDLYTIRHIFNGLGSIYLNRGCYAWKIDGALQIAAFLKICRSSGLLIGGNKYMHHTFLTVYNLIVKTNRKSELAKRLHTQLTVRNCRKVLLAKNMHLKALHTHMRKHRISYDSGIYAL